MLFKFKKNKLLICIFFCIVLSLINCESILADISSNSYNSVVAEDKSDMPNEKEKMTDDGEKLQQKNHMSKYFVSLGLGMLITFFIAIATSRVNKVSMQEEAAVISHFCYVKQPKTIFLHQTKKYSPRGREYED